MSTKNFYMDHGIDAALNGEKYKGLVDGKDYGTNAVEYTVSRGPTLQVQGWHAIDKAARLRIIAELVKRGWIEGEQSKPD